MRFLDKNKKFVQSLSSDSRATNKDILCFLDKKTTFYYKLSMRIKNIFLI